MIFIVVHYVYDFFSSNCNVQTELICTGIHLKYVTTLSEFYILSHMLTMEQKPPPYNFVLVYSKLGPFVDKEPDIQELGLGCLLLIFDGSVNLNLNFSILIIFLSFHFTDIL